MKEILQFIEILISLLLMLVILLQQRGTGLGGAFGSDGFVFRSRRGVEKFLFQATVVLAVAFIGLGIAILTYNRG